MILLHLSINSVLSSILQRNARFSQMQFKLYQFEHPLDEKLQKIADKILEDDIYLSDDPLRRDIELSLRKLEKKYDLYDEEKGEEELEKMLSEMDRVEKRLRAKHTNETFDEEYNDGDNEEELKGEFGEFLDAFHDQMEANRPKMNRTAKTEGGVSEMRTAKRANANSIVGRRTDKYRGGRRWAHASSSLGRRVMNRQGERIEKIKLFGNNGQGIFAGMGALEIIGRGVGGVVVGLAH